MRTCNVGADLLDAVAGQALNTRSAPGPFAQHALAAHAAGLVVVPTSGDDAKRPIVRWRQLRHQPRLSTVDRWADRFPDANIAYLPAPSGLAILDVDDFGYEDRARRLLGIADTPLIIATGKRGLHFPLRTEQAVASVDLRRYGIVGEIKGAGAIVVGPGSVHPETGRQYSFLVGSWGAYCIVPMLNTEALQALIGRDVGAPDEQLRVPGERRNSKGSRNSSTFAHLRALGAVDLFLSEDEVVAEALSYNEAHNDPPEPDRKVIATAKEVWKYVSKGTCKAPKRTHRADIKAVERAALMSLDPKRFKYADALALWLELKLAHEARGQRGETFAIAATAMARDQVIPGWSDRKRYLRATQALVASGLIERVTNAALQCWTGSDGKRRAKGVWAAQYRFVGGKP